MGVKKKLARPPFPFPQFYGCEYKLGKEERYDRVIQWKERGGVKVDKQTKNYSLSLQLDCLTDFDN